ncbi:MAG: hemerythrin domain-containing protein [Myxococcales bacterium]
MALEHTDRSQQSGGPAPDLKAQLVADHAALEGILSKLANTLESNAPTPQLCDEWTRFERSLRDHLDTEERLIFPILANADRGEVEALRKDHQHIRNALAELGVAVELHVLRKASVDELICFLHEHSQREERWAYRCVENHAASHRPLRAMFERRAARHELDQTR